MVALNLTLSVDEKVVQRARKVAEAMGKSLNQVVREYPEELAAGEQAEAWIAEFDRLCDEAEGH